jgi:medium-chain acyl-[acyl-carrier-protein] hydrolase
MRLLARATARAMAPLLDVPFALLGYCLGAYAAFEVARELRRAGKPLPECLLVGGRRAPHLRDPRPPMSRMPDREFIDALHRRHAGLPTHVYANPELLEMYMSILRADFVVLDGYVFVPEPPLPCPIHAFVGTQESAETVNEIRAWSSHTSAGFTLDTVEGKHLNVPEARAGFVRAIVPFL